MSKEFVYVVRYGLEADGANEVLAVIKGIASDVVGFVQNEALANFAPVDEEDPPFPGVTWNHDFTKAECGQVVYEVEKHEVMTVRRCR